MSKTGTVARDETSQKLKNGKSKNLRREGPAVSVSNLTKVYGKDGSAVKAVDDISLDIEHGSVVGILGPNGAGKTTTIKAAVGLLTPTQGSVEIAGVDVKKKTKQAYRHVSAVLEGNRNVYWRLTVRENLNYFASLQGINPKKVEVKHDRIIERLGLTDKTDEPVKNLSRGMKQKVALGCALARDTPVMFLDEPTLGLDVQTSYDLRKELKRLVDEDNRTVILSSHDMDVVQDLCERVIIMNEGRIVADDSVENLIDVFRTHAYRIAVEGDLTSEHRRYIRDNYRVDEWRENGDRTSFEVTLDSGEEFYGMMDRLKEANVTIVSVSSIEPDLEEVFLRITNEEKKEVVR